MDATLDTSELYEVMVERASVPLRGVVLGVGVTVA